MDEYLTSEEHTPKAATKSRFDLNAVLDALERHPIASITIGVGFVATLFLGHDIMNHNYALQISRQNGISFAPSTNPTRL